MIVWLCTNEACPRHGMRTEKVCLAENGKVFKDMKIICGRSARKDYS